VASDDDVPCSSETNARSAQSVKQANKRRLVMMMLPETNNINVGKLMAGELLVNKIKTKRLIALLQSYSTILVVA
jgi:hypothetical protein